LVLDLGMIAEISDLDLCVPRESDRRLRRAGVASF
jgi:hypothetical protein